MRRARTRAQRIAILAFLVFPLMTVVFGGLIWAVYALWNGLMPEIFGVHAITYWQALGLMVLSWILFGGLRGRTSSGGRWRHRIRERWGRMNPAEREEFLKGLDHRCGAPGAPEPEPKA